jgi:hypothetical protein
MIVLDRDRTFWLTTKWSVHTPSVRTTCSQSNELCWHSCRKLEKMYHENTYHETLVLYCTYEAESHLLAFLLGFNARIVPLMQTDFTRRNALSNRSYGKSMKIIRSKSQLRW